MATRLYDQAVVPLGRQAANIANSVGVLKSPEHGLGINMGKNLNYP